MYVITVAPLKRGISPDGLTYFSSEPYTEGTLLEVPIRNKEVLGLVTNIKPVSKAKTALRTATFSLRKLPVQKDAKKLGEALIKTAQELSSFYATSLGSLMYSMLPPEIRRGDVEIPHTHYVKADPAQIPQILQAQKKERLMAYKSLVRETFAHSGSVLLVTPTSIEVNEMKNMLEQGIEDRVIIFSPALTKSQLKKSYAALEDFSQTKLIITTPTYALLERHDITLTILEHVRSAFYRTMSRPYLDYRKVLITHAKYTGRKCLMGDLLVRTEEEYLRRADIYQARIETPKRIDLQGKLKVISTALNPEKPVEYKLFSTDVIDAIKTVKKKRGKIFIFAARRGIAPMVMCVDCGHIFRSPQSGAPYSLMRTKKDGKEERWFVCGASGEKKRAPDVCTKCGSWRLREQGVGIQHVYDELHKLFPKIPTVLFDHISAKTYKKALFLRDTFYKSKGVIMLGTQMAIPYLSDDIDLSIVVNMDAMLATPTWRLEEENLSFLFSLREITKGDVMVQTRSPEAEVLAHAKRGSVENFYNEELELRKQFKYPPFNTFIHLTWQGNKDTVKKTEELITELLKDFKPSIYQNPTSSENAPIMYCLLRIKSKKWPDKKLVDALKSLPPSVRLMINPDKII